VFRLDTLKVAWLSVTSARLLEGREEIKRGFAFVKFDSTASAQAAIDNLNNTSVNGRNIRVCFSKSEPFTANGNDRFQANHNQQIQDNHNEFPSKKTPSM